MITNPISPHCFCCPVVVREGEQSRDDVGSEDEVDPKHALMDEPIIGMENVTWEDGKGSGAIPAKPLPSPKTMTEAQRRIHDITHLPYDPGCPICVSCRRPNDHHRRVKDSERTIPLIVADYGFPKNSEDDEALTLLIMRVYPYKICMCTWVPSKGRDPRVIARIVRFIKENGLTHFAYRSDREPAITAMIEEACAMSGRKGVKVTSEEAPGDDGVNLDDLAKDGILTDEDLTISDVPKPSSNLTVDSTHVGAPEVSHPGESQSNGLAERSVGEFVDQLRTLKTALESRLKARLSSSHPVTHWLVEHTAYVLNKFSLGPDGRTAYGRLHGREGRERMCEFGERIMWFVPKKVRAKLDQRWRYGIFLGRSMSSDQNFVGLANGDVVCARAIVRLVPGLRWDVDKIDSIRITPFDFKTRNQDTIEEDPDPHNHPEPKPSDAEPAVSRRLKIFDSDIKRFGYTDGCPRCDCARKGQLLRAKSVRHNEECRNRLYDAMREAGVEKMKRADDEDPGRTKAQPKTPAKKSEDSPGNEPKLVDAPMEPIDDTPDQVAEDVELTGADDDMFDTTDFHNVVNGDVDHGLEVEHDGDDIMEPAEDHIMSQMMDVLQTIGVSATDAANHCAHIMRETPKRPTQFGEPYNPTLFEVYGQGNIVEASRGCRRNLNIDGLMAFDLRTCKPSGEAWDFCKASDRRMARQYVEEMKPTWVIGCPPCTFFSKWNQGMNHRKMNPDLVEELRREAVKHLRFVIGLYKIQLDGGRHFLHEHPETATSWMDPSMIKLLNEKRVGTTVSDQCEYGLLTPGPNGKPMAAKKPTKWMSSSPHMLKRLSKRCSKNHAHQQLVGGRAKAAENYPLELITQILRGMRDTADFEEEWGDAMEVDLDNAVMTAGLLHDVQFSSIVAAYRAEDLKSDTEKLHVKFKHLKGPVETVQLVFKDSYKDEYTCEELPMGHVRLAMQEELEYFCDKVWVGVPISEAMADKDGKIIGSRWVNCNKNDINDPDVRCRLVAQEVNLHADDSFYAATTPLEAKRLLFSEWASRQDVYMQLSFVDVKKAYLYRIPEQRLYVRFPPELGMPKNMVGKLVRCMYGTRDAGAIWENCYTKCLLDLGFEQGVASPCSFTHAEWGVSVVVHGDDFTALGTPDGLDKYEKGMTQTFECKMKGRLGTKASDLKEMRVLNRIVRITDTGLRYEADPRHVELLAKSLNMENCRPVVTPGVKVPFDDDAQPSDDPMDDVILEQMVSKVTHISKVKFDLNPGVYEVPTQVDNYGMHPRDFDFDYRGRMRRRRPQFKEEILNDHVTNASPNARRLILQRTLRDGAAWEEQTTEIIAKITKSSKKKFLKARLGTKAAKQHERLENVADELEGEAATMFRALSARVLYLSMDRPECAFAAKELCRQFANPTKKGVEALKRAARFLVGMPRLVYDFQFQKFTNSLQVFVDTDFGGCHATRRSTSGGVAMRGGHCIKHWSTTQTTVALSSGEAELGGICRGSSVGLGLQSLARDLSIDFELEVLTDATAAIGICRRRGLGKIRHLHTADLWIQDRLRKGDFKLTKVLGVDNPADMLTKHILRDTMLKHMSRMGLRSEEGRAQSAPTIQHK